jgi:hypothetical protein
MPQVPRTVQQATGGLPRQMPGSPQDLGRGMVQGAKAAVENVLPGASDAAAARDSYLIGQQIGPALREGRYGDAVRAFVESTAAAVGVLPGVPALHGVAAAMFGGAKAATADLAKLNRARQMAEAGSDPKAIWKETGWFKGAEGEWKFEISDETARFRNDPREWQFNEARTAAASTVQGALYHPKLTDAYPEVGEQGFGFGPSLMGESGMQLPGRLNVTANTADIRDVASGRMPKRNNKFSTSLHEAQHAVQDVEGFARGGNPAEFEKVYGDLSANANKLQAARAVQMRMKHHSEDAVQASEAIGEQAGVDPALLRQLVDAYPGEKLAQATEKATAQAKDYEPRSRYMRLAGEAEARLVQKRADYTDEQRRAIFPLEDLDVPAGQLIVRRPEKPAAERAAEGMSALADPLSWVKD